MKSGQRRAGTVRVNVAPKVLVGTDDDERDGGVRPDAALFHVSDEAVAIDPLDDRYDFGRLGEGGGEQDGGDHD